MEMVEIKISKNIPKYLKKITLTEKSVVHKLFLEKNQNLQEQTKPLTSSWKRIAVLKLPSR